MIAAKRECADVPLRYAARKITLPPGEIAEIRLRTGKCAAAVMTDGRMLRCSDIFTREDITECFLELCRNSVHSYAQEIAEGYITLPGGNRVGFCGTGVLHDGKLTTLKDISSLNIRFAREVCGCAEELCRRVFPDGLCSVVICGKPLSGKTTVLRDMARILGQNHRISLIDSRGELAGVSGGIPALDVGENTDILSGYPKAEGIMCALRSLSPEMIVCDEIGSDSEEVRQCMGCGVKFAVTAHAGSLDELRSRPGICGLYPLFDRAVLLERGRIADIREIRA